MVVARDALFLRTMTATDIEDVLDVQEPGAVIGLAEVFPQDAYPFPREEIAARWRREIDAPDTDCYCVVLGEVVTGFAATRRDEFLHFGIAVDQWGSGLAAKAHDAVLDRLREQGLGRSWLTVFTGNRRGRRFYEKLGWQATGERTRSSFAPYPELLRYERTINDRSG